MCLYLCIYIYIYTHIYIYIHTHTYIYIWANHMSLAEWADTYCIHHWRTLWSSYRKLASERFKPTTTEFRSDALTNWAIRAWGHLALRAKLVQLLQFHRLFSVTFHFGHCIYICFRVYVYVFVCLCVCKNVSSKHLC